MHLDRGARRVLAVYDGSAVPRAAGATPRVAIVGAGLAGLAAAHVLARAGCRATVYEASARIGGRVWTDHDACGSGLVGELGGEFIDSRHHDMLALAALFGLALIDTGSAAEAQLSTSYFFAGRHYTEAEVAAAFAQVAPRIARDAARLGGRVSRRRHTPAVAALDRLSIAEYLDGLGLDGWLRSAIEVAYVTEYGLDAAEQSSINLLSLIGTDPRAGFQIFGGSDERYKVRDGADRIAHGLAAGLRGAIRMEHRLVRVRGDGAGYRLSFDTPGKARQISADVVVFALPFTMLRRVDLGDSVPPAKQRAIDQLGYGNNCKLLLGLRSRFWRDAGRDGGLYTDLDCQTGWDSSRLREGGRGVYAYYLGGRQGIDVGRGPAEEQAARMAALTERVFPGFASQCDGCATRVHWPSEPFAQGSYTCYRPGQWTTIAGDESPRVGKLYFAGEHCATDSQGYMDGAAQTGRRAAQAILRSLV